MPATMHVFKNEITEWVIAESPEDAVAVFLEHVGGTREDHEDYDFDFVQCPDGEPLTIRTDDGPAGTERRTQTCAEWAAEEGRGFLASTEV